MLIVWRSVIDANITAFKRFQGIEKTSWKWRADATESLNTGGFPSHPSQPRLALLFKQVHFSSSCWDCQRSWGSNSKQAQNWAVGGLPRQGGDPTQVNAGSQSPAKDQTDFKTLLVQRCEAKSLSVSHLLTWDLVWGLGLGVLYGVGRKDIIKTIHFV